MDKGFGVCQILELNLTAGNGAEKIIQKIATSSLRERLLLRNDIFLRKEWYEKHLVNYLEFFSPKEGLADTAELLESLFPLEPLEDSQAEEALQEPEMEEEQKTCEVFLEHKQEERWEEGEKNPRIYLKILKCPFQIPFVLELIPYEGRTLPLEEKILENTLSERVTYCMFTPEEYLSRCFYQMIDDLELIHSLSWYKDSYDILVEKIIEGRKVSQSFGQLLLENSIPSLKERLDIINSFKDYEYMQKRWENYSKLSFYPIIADISSNDYSMKHLEWNQMIELLMKFFTPIFEAVLRDEVFIGDWIPQVGRYLG